MRYLQGFLFAIIFVAGWAYIPAATSDTSISPSALRKLLFKNYDKNVRPVKEFTDVIPTQIGLSPVSILEVDEEKEIVVIDAWIAMVWKDSYLAWDPSEHDGIQSLNVPSSEIWKPDITTYTSSPIKQLLPQVFTNVILFSNGEIIWVPPLTISSRCPLDMSNYPFDTQLCVIVLGSWTYGSKTMDLQMYKKVIDLDYFADNNAHWSLVGATAERFEKFYPCCPNESYPSMNFNLTLKRKQSAPVKIAKSISYFAGFLALLMFWLPPDSVYKVLLGVISEVFLGMTVLFVAHAVPSPEASLKAAARIYPAMCAVAGLLIIEVLIMNLARVMGPCRPPRCLLAIAKGCCTMCCVCISRPYPGGDLRMEPGHSEKMKKGRPSAQEDWNLVAMALDRLLFIIALVISIFFYKFW